jgi:hypothetical protein
MTPDPQEYLEQLAEGRKPPMVGPSDSSDTAADLIGATVSGDALGALGSSDRNGTGERFGAEAQETEDAADIGFDRVVERREAGLGGGLDQAEEARLGITDEQLEELAGDPAETSPGS